MLARRLQACTNPLPSIQFVGAYTDATSASSYTFSGVAVGAAAPSRRLFVVAIPIHSITNSVTAVTVNGSAATLHVAQSATNRPLALASILRPTGTTANITVTLSAAASGGCVILVFAAYDLRNSTPHDTRNVIGGSTANVITSPITTPKGGIVLAVSSKTVTAGGCSWLGVNELTDASYLSAARVSSAALTALAAGSINGEATWSGTADLLRLALISWR